MSRKTFISYSRVDGQFAQRLASDLRTANVDVWIDQAKLRPGHTWPREVEAGLQECTFVVVVLSPDAVKSDNVMNEVAYAIDKKKIVLPVLYRECDIPLELIRKHRPDFTSDYVRGLADLVRVFGLTVRPKGQAQSRPAYQSPQPPPSQPSPDIPPQPHLPAPKVPWRRFWTRAWIPGYPRVDTALKTGLAGAFAGFCVLLAPQVPSLLLVGQYNPDPFSLRDMSGLLLGSGKLFGVPWFIAGAIAGPRRGPLLCAYVTGLFAFMAWLVFYDSFIALLFGWAGGGVVGALIGVAMLRSQGKVGVRESWREKPG
jgi:hypothetical protein